jgi:ABC-2 type transport system permease protein
MTTPSNDSVAGSQVIAPAAVSEPRPLYWSVRRELWENRFLYIAPLLITAVVLFGSLIRIISLASEHAVALKPFRMAPAPIMLATFVIGFFYSLDALYGERRDRSILFWKSLPVSDFTTVLSKASIPLVVLPLIAFALSVVTQLILLVLSAPFLLGSGVAGETWGKLHFFEGLMVMLYGLTVHALWFAPIYGWLMLISAWARRAPFLWAVLPPLALAALERIMFNTHHFISLLGYRVSGAMGGSFAIKAGGDGSVERIWQLTPGKFLTTPGLWVGLLAASAFLAAAVRLRRSREPI